MSDLASLVTSPLDPEVRLLAAIAYGEASTLGCNDEVLGIAYAVVNRCAAWNHKTVSEIIAADKNYTYAVQGSCVRFNMLKSASIPAINSNREMVIAVNSAINALAGTGNDPSNGAYWWDGKDLKQKHNYNPRIKYGFKYGDPSHNIFDMSEILINKKLYKIIKNKKTGVEKRTILGQYDCTYISKAAHGRTIFWRYTPEFVSVTKTKEYR